IQTTRITTNPSLARKPSSFSITRMAFSRAARRGRTMPGRKERDQLGLLITGSLRQLIPDDRALVRVDRVLDLSWLRDEGADLYCRADGRRGIDLEVAVRFMLAGLLSGSCMQTFLALGQHFALQG